MKRLIVLCLATLLYSPSSWAQGVPIKSGADSNLATVNSAKALLTVDGASTRPTYIATVAGATTTAAYNLQVESSASLGFKAIKICVTYSHGATAAGTVITTTVSRRTTASSAGTALTNNGTGTTAVTQLDPTAGAYGGLARGLAATLGTAGATVDQWQFPQTVVAGTTGITPISMVCKNYGDGTGEQPIIVAAGVTNGLAVNVSAGGAGSLAVGSISMLFVAE
jgi:hypothetical protein